MESYVSQTSMLLPSKRYSRAGQQPLSNVTTVPAVTNIAGRNIENQRDVIGYRRTENAVLKTKLGKKRILLNCDSVEDWKLTSRSYP